MTVLLLGTDFSPNSDRALRRAVLLARATDSELLIVAVDETEGGEREREQEPDRADPMLSPPDTLALLNDMQRTITDHDRVRCRVELRRGQPPEQLADAAAQSRATIMIIGPHQRSRMRDAFGSITAERIVEHSPVPLICASGVPSGPYRRLLLPVDLSDSSRRSTEVLRDLARAGDAEVVLLHVYDAEAREMLSRGLVPAEDRRRYLAERGAAAEAQLRDFARSVELADATLVVEESSGSLTADIQRVAAQESADLIVLAESDKGTIARTLLGSVTRDLLRSAQRDVLVIPASQ